MVLSRRFLPFPLSLVVFRMEPALCDLFLLEKEKPLEANSGPLNCSHSKGLCEGSVGGSAVTKVISVRGGQHGRRSFYLLSANFHFLIS